MSAPPVDPLRHLGLVYDTPDDLAVTALPELRAALDRGDDVTLVVDRRVARAVREHLGPDADRAHFPPPSELLGADTRAALRELRDRVPQGPAVRAGGRALLLSQSDLATATDAEFQEVEESVSLTLADLPLTVLCCYARDADPDHTAVCRRVHPQLVGTRGAADNPDYLAPDRGAVPLAVAGTPTFWLSFHDTADLRRVRTGTARAAAEAGLVGESAEAAVLAVHEAAVLACLAAEAARSGRDAGDCVLELHTEPGALTCEVRAAGDLGSHLQGRPPDPLAHIRPFCRSITLPHPHVVRLVTDAEWAFDT